MPTVDRIRKLSAENLTPDFIEISTRLISNINSVGYNF